MSSSTCSAQDTNTFDCQWNYDKVVKSDVTVKASVRTRRKREFTPNELKDENYWMKRSRNNEAAKRSRERRRMEERLMEEQALHLLRENEKLKAALSAINYPGSVGKKTSYDNFMNKSPVQESLQDARTQMDFPEATRSPHYALSGRFFSSAYESVTLPRMQSLPAASFPSVDNKQQRDKYPELNAPNNENVTCCSPLYENTQRKLEQGYAMNFHSNSARFAVNKMLPCSQYPAKSSPNHAVHTFMNESRMEQGSIANEPEKKCDEIKNEPKRVLASPLLPHKLRLKVNNARRDKERALLTAGISKHL